MTGDGWIAFIVAPILILLTVPAVARQARRENDGALVWLLVVALVLKFGGALFRHYVSFEVYNESDAAAFHEQGLGLAEQFRAGHWAAAPDHITDQNLLGFLTGLVYTVVGPSTLAGFLIFSWLGFWGLFLFYRAFHLAVPEGRTRSYARLLFFLPSMLYWTSSIGKESWMIFALGIAAFGVARTLTGAVGRGIGLVGLGLWFAALLRPHIATIAAVALVAAFLARRPSRESPLAPVVKLVALVAVSVVALFLFRDAEQFLTRSKVNPGGDVLSVSEEVTTRTRQGGSAFEPHPVLESPEEAPLAFFTVLFRPTIVEANNTQALVAAVESSFLLLVSLVRLPWAMSALRSLRRQPYLAYALVTVGLSIAALSVLANFGLLARQRTLFMPLYLAFLAVPPRKKTDEQRSDDDGDLVVKGAEAA